MAAKAGQDSKKVCTLMPPEAIGATNDAVRHYVAICDLTKATGETNAQLTGNEEALVVTGAVGAIFMGTCGTSLSTTPPRGPFSKSQLAHVKNALERYAECSNRLRSKGSHHSRSQALSALAW